MLSEETWWFGQFMFTIKYIIYSFRPHTDTESMEKQENFMHSISIIHEYLRNEELHKKLLIDLHIYDTIKDDVYIYAY
jgi:hypothetical protein